MKPPMDQSNTLTLIQFLCPFQRESSVARWDSRSFILRMIHRDTRVFIACFSHWWRKQISPASTHDCSLETRLSTMSKKFNIRQSWPEAASAWICRNKMESRLHAFLRHQASQSTTANGGEIIFHIILANPHWMAGTNLLYYTEYWSVAKALL